MKTRNGFVSNSSSSSFIIQNKTNENKSILDFALENAGLYRKYNQEYGDDVKIGDLILSAEEDYSHIVLCPGENECYFGDESGNVLGRVYDYILREGGESISFSWKFYKSCR